MPRPALRLTAFLSLALAVTGCATNPNPTGQVAVTNGVADPWEGFNRQVYAFNNGVDKAVLRPAAVAYRAVVPEDGRDMVRNFLANLRSPLDFGNKLLQGDVSGAGTVLGRFVINTTVGVGGLLDPAAKADLPYSRGDFGQTMAVWGVESGPYMVIPILGPSTARDTVGYGVDYFTDPINYLPAEYDGVVVGRLVLTTLDARERILDEWDDIRAKSLDEYAAIRSIYLQRREAQIRGSKSGPTTNSSSDGPNSSVGTAEIPDYAPAAPVAAPEKTPRTQRPQPRTP